MPCWSFWRCLGGCCRCVRLRNGTRLCLSIDNTESPSCDGPGPAGESSCRRTHNHTGRSRSTLGADILASAILLWRGCGFRGVALERRRTVPCQQWLAPASIPIPAYRLSLRTCSGGVPPASHGADVAAISGCVASCASFRRPQSPGTPDSGEYARRFGETKHAFPSRSVYRPAEVAGRPPRAYTVSAQSTQRFSSRHRLVPELAQIWPDRRHHALT